VESQEEIIEDHVPIRINCFTKFVFNGRRIKEIAFGVVGGQRRLEPALYSALEKRVLGHAITVGFAGKHQIGKYPEERFQVVKVIVQRYVLRNEVATPERQKRLK
jgi:hypothetical protein